MVSQCSGSPKDLFPSQINRLSFRGFPMQHQDYTQYLFVRPALPDFCKTQVFIFMHSEVCWWTTRATSQKGCTLHYFLLSMSKGKKKKGKRIMKVAGGFWKPLQAPAKNSIPSFKLKVWMSSLTCSNAKETLAIFQELVRETERARVQQQHEKLLVQQLAWIQPPRQTSSSDEGELGSALMQHPKASFAPASPNKSYTHNKQCFLP